MLEVDKRELMSGADARPALMGYSQTGEMNILRLM
jgi:hypothetical protein